MFFLYSVFLYLLYFFVKIGSFFNPKINDFRKGRSDLWSIIRSRDLSNCIWFHVSSLGEFEQIRNVIETIKKTHPSEKILLTFFSPSGYNHQKNYSFADAVCYLPYDFNKDVNEFIKIVQPRVAIWVRYEFWLNVLNSLKKHGVPTLLINGVFRDSVSIFYVSYLNRCLSLFTSMYVINDDSKQNLKKLGFESILIPDSRIDRVMNIKNEEFHHPILEHFCDSDKSIIVAGSTWIEDENMFRTLNFSEFKLIIVPHNVDEKRIGEIKNRFSSSQCFTKYDQRINSDVLVVDTIGMLSKIYRYGTINYVGGGFNKVVHSVLEPLVYLKPIFFGPNYVKNEEAKDLIKEGIAVSVYKVDEIYDSLHKKTFNPTKAFSYISSKSNATQKIIDLLIN